jgi:hypothetical protein
LHVFEWTSDHTLERRGSARTEGPLSGFADIATPSNLAAHIRPALDQAAAWISPQYHASTRILYQATAGMRLLTTAQQEAIYDAMYQGLKQDPTFVFKNLQRSDLQTLSGELEGFYGAVAVNYLHGTVDAQLKYTNTSQPIGALDMGGSSTQIVFLPGPDELADHPVECMQHIHNVDTTVEDSSAESRENSSCPTESVPDALHPAGHFFATSYLSYGVDQFRERLWNLWVQEHVSRNATCIDDLQQQCVSQNVIANPCANAGWETEWQGHTLLGTGYAAQCVEQVQRLIPHPEIPVEFTPGTRHVGGVRHPPVRGRFLAMSMFFFALDTLRELSGYAPLQEQWPTPTLQELHTALHGMCSRPWNDDMQYAQHSFTRPAILPHRCLEAVYLVTLLKDGYGFDPEARDITYTFTIDGSEVEWTLGMALILKAQERELLLEADAMAQEEAKQEEKKVEPEKASWNSYSFGLWEEATAFGIIIS